MAKIPVPRFTLKDVNAKTRSLVYLIYRYRGLKLRYSTQISIAMEDWNRKTQRPHAKERRPDLSAIRRKLENISENTKDIYIEYNYGDLSKEQFKRELDIRLDRVEVPRKKKTLSFFEFMDAELAEMEATGMKYGSLKVFKAHSQILKQYAADKGEFCYEDVNWSLRLKLIDWLAARKVQLAYGNKTLNDLRQFMERARRKGLHLNTGYQGQGWQVRPLKAEGEKVALIRSELEVLASMPLKGHLKKVRNLLLIGAGTGQRFSDFSRLKPEQFYKTTKGMPLLSVISQKTATPAKISLNIFTWLIPVLGEHEYQSPQMSMQKFNDGLKVLCKKSWIDDEVLVVEQYMGRKPKLVKRFVPKYKLVTSHICRRSFATNLYRMGYALAQIMPMTGHATEAQLRLYIGIDAEENAEQIALSIEKKKLQNA